MTNKSASGIADRPNEALPPVRVGRFLNEDTGETTPVYLDAESAKHFRSAFPATRQK